MRRLLSYCLINIAENFVISNHVFFQNQEIEKLAKDNENRPKKIRRLEEFQNQFGIINEIKKKVISSKNKHTEEESDANLGLF